MDKPDYHTDWTLLRAFHVTAETGSLSAAARMLGLSQPTLSRQVGALEAALNVILFERVGRGLQLTEAGRRLLPHVQQMAEAAGNLSLTASALGSDLSGTVRITASHAYAAYLLPQILLQVRDTAPQLRPFILASDSIADLLRREADIALRHVRPSEPELVARLVCEARAHFYAAQSYLDRHGRPNSVAELVALDWISPGDDERFVGYLRNFGIPITDKALQSGTENGVISWEMARAGLGVCPMDRRIAARYPEMEALLPEQLEIHFPVWLVTHREVHTSAKIRLVFDTLAKALTGE